MTFADRYRRWFNYEKDANAKVLAAFQAVAPAFRSRPEYRKAVDLMAHVAAARLMWLVRMGAAETGPTTIDQLEPHDSDLAALPDALQEAERSWSAYLAKLTDTELSRTVEYRAMDGGAFSNTVEEILTQLFGHGWYHRGQIGTLLRSIGAEPASTDYIFWARQSVGEARKS